MGIFQIFRVIGEHLGWVNKQSELRNNPEMKANVRAKNDNKESDKNAELIRKSQTGDKDALEELRRRTSG